MANAVDINSLSFEYEEGAKTIDQISFSVPKGSYTVVLGHNGSGKSTIAKLIIGLLEPKTGDITVDGIHLDEEHLYDVREKVGIVFQNPDNQFIGSSLIQEISLIIIGSKNFWGHLPTVKWWNGCNTSFFH